mmetsp:Transcript_51548/g.130304  ORF Transcript_51548/g.130304 Transcript_51548/m.130304 type:complete len:215 (-) Transcript_51548:349-993(-)
MCWSTPTGKSCRRGMDPESALRSPPVSLSLLVATATGAVAAPPPSPPTSALPTLDGSATLVATVVTLPPLLTGAAAPAAASATTSGVPLPPPALPAEDMSSRPGDDSDSGGAAFMAKILRSRHSECTTTPSMERKTCPKEPRTRESRSKQRFSQAPRRTPERGSRACWGLVWAPCDWTLNINRRRVRELSVTAISREKGRSGFCGRKTWKTKKG